MISAPFLRRRLKYIFRAMVFAPAVFILGCGASIDLKRARGYARKSDKFYDLASGYYQKALRSDAEEGFMLEAAEFYFKHAAYAKAVELLKRLKGPEAEKLLAVSYFHLADFTEALSVFDRLRSSKEDQESLYYHGLTCEKLNLYPKAQELYSMIRSGSFFAMASERLKAINRSDEKLKLADLDEETRDIISSSADKEAKYPDAGSLILLSDEKISVLDNNTVVSEMRYIIKILNERGKEDFSEVQIDYDSTDETVELEYARTIRPDGSVITVGDKHIRDVSRYLNFPLYSNAKVKIISMPEVSDGCFVEYKARIISRRMLNDKDIILNYRLQEAEPIIKSRFEFVAPAGKSVRQKMINEAYNIKGEALAPVRKTEKGFQKYSIDISDVAQIIPEAAMPPAAEVDAMVLFSTFDSWEEISRWWWKLAEGKIRANDEIKAKVAELLREKNSDEEKARAIYDFCAKDIRYVAVEYGQAGHEPHQASEIFANKYGDCKDKAVLLVTMLRDVGFKEAYPVLLGTKGTVPLEKDFPATFFNHAIAVIYLDGKAVFMDATAETCSFGDVPAADQGRDVLVIKDGSFSIERIPLFGADKNRIIKDTRIKVDEDGSIKAERRVSAFGQYEQAQRAWLIYTQPELIKENLQLQVQSFCVGGKLIDYRVKNLKDSSLPVILEYSYSGPEFLVSAGDLKMVPPLGGIDTSIVAKAERRYPVDLDLPQTLESRIEIEIPNGLSIKYIPGDIRKNSEWFDFVVEYKIERQKIIFRQSEVRKKTFIPANEYPAFKSDLEELGKALKERVVLEVKK